MPSIYPVSSTHRLENPATSPASSCGDAISWREKRSWVPRNTHHEPSSCYRFTARPFDETTIDCSEATSTVGHISEITCPSLVSRYIAMMHLWKINYEQHNRNDGWRVIHNSQSVREAFPAVRGILGEHVSDGNLLINFCHLMATGSW